MTEKKKPASDPAQNATQSSPPTEPKGQGQGPDEPPGTKSDRPGVKDGSLPPGLQKK